MKIRLLQDYLRSGGTERQSILLGKLFQRAGHDTELITFRPGGVLQPTVAPVKRRALQPFDTGIDGWAPRLTTIALRESPDVVLCMGRMANCWAGSLAERAARSKLSTSVIATMRTGRALPWLFRRSLQKVKQVVANSEAARATLQNNYDVPAEKISVIRNAIVFFPEDQGVAGTRSETARIALRKEWGADPKTLVLLWVGMFRAEKNQRAMIEIAAKLPRSLPWQLWFAGDGPTRRECEAHARVREVQDRVKFLGFQIDPRPLYRAADVAVLTSQSESLPNFLIEAHAHALPSVAYAVSGVQECGGIAIEAENEIGFLGALGTLLENADLRKIEGARVATFAREHFSPEIQGRAYLDLFEKLMSSR